MLSQVPYSKAPFWQILLFSYLLVVLCPFSCTVSALPASEDATKTDKREASAISNEDTEGIFKDFTFK